jgi:DHA3 family tetracycline resistance protein-like MFS transporter
MLLKRDATRVFVAMSGARALFFSLVVVTNIVYQIEVAHLDPLRVLLIGTVLEATCLVFQVPTGILADAHSRHATVVLGYGLWGAGFVVEGLFPSFWPIVLAQVIWGAGASLVDGADSAWISDEVGPERAAGLFIRAGQVGSVTALAGIGLGAVLASVQLNLPIVLGGSLLVALGFWLALAMPECGFAPTRGSSPLRGATNLLRLRPVLYTILAVNFFAAMSSEGFDRLQQFHLLRDTGIPTLAGHPPVLWFGVLAAVSSLLGLAGLQAVRRWVDLNSHRCTSRSLLLVISVLVAGLLGFALAQTFVVAVGFLWTARLMRRLYTPVQHAWMNQSLEPASRATLFSVNGLVDALGQITAGPLIGIVASLISLPAALAGSALMLCPVLLLLAFGGRLPAKIVAGPELGV